MKANRVAILIMVMLGFVQILKSEAKLRCPVSCAFACLVSNKNYVLCFAECVVKCEIPFSASNCVRSCGANKTITVDIGIYSYLFNVFFFITKLNMFLHFSYNDFMYQMLVVK